MHKGHFPEQIWDSFPNNLVNVSKAAKAGAFVYSPETPKRKCKNLKQRARPPLDIVEIHSSKGKDVKGCRAIDTKETFFMRTDFATIQNLS